MLVQSMIIFNWRGVIISLAFVMDNQINVKVVLRVGRQVGSGMRARPCSRFRRVMGGSPPCREGLVSVTCEAGRRAGDPTAPAPS